jgi:hypothetical protein
MMGPVGGDLPPFPVHTPITYLKGGVEFSLTSCGQTWTISAKVLIKVELFQQTKTSQQELL